MQIKLPVQESKEIFSLIAFVWQRKEKFLIGLVGVAALAIFLARGVAGKTLAFGDYVLAAGYQAKLEGQKEFDQKGLLQLLKKHPELKPLFAHYLEQNLALSGDLVGLRGISEESLKRLSFIDPVYHEFAKNSLLIEEGKYEEALANAIQMREKVKREMAPNLYGLNLIRIAFLESLLGKKKTKLEDVLSQELRAHLKDDKLSLIDFVMSH